MRDERDAAPARARRRCSTNFGDIAKAGKQIISTSIPASELDTFVNLSLKTKSLPVSTVSFVPPKINTGDPDYQQIRSMVDDGGCGVPGQGRRQDDAEAAPAPTARPYGQRQRQPQLGLLTPRIAGNVGDSTLCRADLSRNSRREAGGQLPIESISQSPSSLTSFIVNGTD